MPHHSVDVIDLGLTVDTAIGLGLEPEEVHQGQRRSPLAAAGAHGGAGGGGE
jgi:hypothetical protein